MVILKAPLLTGLMRPHLTVSSLRLAANVPMMIFEFSAMMYGMMSGALSQKKRLTQHIIIFRTGCGF
jgi:hypothetical protein